MSNPIIALVDDDSIFQLTASKTIKLSFDAAHILQFMNGEDAMQFLRTNMNDAAMLPDYIFLDINMPLMDGWMFLDDFEKIKNNLPKRVNIYMVSSSIDPSDIRRAKNNGNVVDYVTKPVTREKFTALISA